ncbi:MAG TPA: DUF5682 family protein, partial [Stellaceae bacterium]|nr:DUF5682 family protein [Stellaceae bacterium]
FDALLSAGIKDELEVGEAPLLAAFTAYLRGDRLGELPAGSRLPPLVEAARRMARALGFTLEDALPKTRKLDIYRKSKHRAGSRFLHAMRLIAPPFAERLAGPDLVHGFKAEMLFETWRYAWSPAVEAALIEHAGEGDNVRDAAAAVLIRSLDELRKAGRGHDAHAVMNCLAIAVDAGIDAAPLIAAASTAAVEDSDLHRLAKALLVGHALNARAEEGLAAFLSPLLDRLARRLAELLPEIRAIDKEEAAGAVAALASLAEFLANPAPDLDTGPLRAGIKDLLPLRLDPALQGAVTALASLIGLIDHEEAGRRLAASLAGISEEPGEAMRTVAGVMALAPRISLSTASW